MVPGFTICYIHFSVLAQIQLRERFDRTREELAHFTWSHSVGWLCQLRGENWEEDPNSPSFPAFCLFKLLVFECQLSSLCKDKSIWSPSGGNFLFPHRVLHISRLLVHIWGWREKEAILGSVKLLGGTQVFVSFFKNKGTEPRRAGLQALAFQQRASGQQLGLRGSDLKAEISVDYLHTLGQHTSMCALCSSPVCKPWDLQGFLGSLTGEKPRFSQLLALLWRRNKMPVCPTQKSVCWGGDPELR